MRIPRLFSALLLWPTLWGVASGAGEDGKAGGVIVVTDTSGTPDLEPWAKESKALVETWYPVIAELLKSDGFEPPGRVTLVFSDRLKGVAETSGARITVAADWVRKHPEDKGMVVHELTHVVQSYPPSRDGWLVEGIADYVRFFRYEPGTAIRIRDPKKASYRDGYRTSAKFLDWVEKTYDRGAVARLNGALRRGEYRDRLFRDMTGHTLPDLWDEFIRAETSMPNKSPR